MRLTQLFLMDVLRFHLRRDLTLNCGAVDWDVFARICRIHNIEGIAYSALKSSSIKMPLHVEASLRKGYLAAVVYGERQDEALQTFKSLLENEEIQYLPFKGAVIKDLYPEPCLRTKGDIDILIRAQDLGACHQIMTRLGYERLQEDNAIPYAGNGIRFEIHCRLDYALPTIKETDDVWQHAVASNLPFGFKLDSQYQLVLILDHMAKHAFRGFGIRMLMDVVVWQLEYQTAFNMKTFCAELSRRGILEFSKRIFALCQRMFGTESPFENYTMTDSVYEILSDFILNGGAFGSDNTKLTGIDFMLGKKYIIKKSSFMARLSILLWLVFPPYNAVSKEEYAYLKGRPFLLPIAWIHRGFDKLSKFRIRTLASVKGIFRGKYGEDLKLVLREFGL